MRTATLAETYERILAGAPFDVVREDSPPKQP
jgi:hypothetical protein